MNDADTQAHDHRSLAALLPHGEGMALFDQVESCSDENIVVVSRQHHQPDFPFEVAGKVDSAMLVEYGAQAAGLHAALISTEDQRVGRAVIGVVRGLKLHAEYFMQTAPQVRVIAELRFANSSGAMYSFVAEVEDRIVAEGQLGLMRDS